MDSVTLFELKNDDIQMFIGARLDEGSLVIEGQDLGKKVESFWGESEYEYFYSLSLQDTKKLKTLLRQEENDETNILVLVQHHFSGKDACTRFQEYCKTYELSVKFFSC